MKISRLTAGIVLLLAGINVHGQDFSGTFTIAFASAPNLALEVVDGEKSDGAKIALGEPYNVAYQKWIFTPRKDGFYSISPAHARDLVLTVVDGGTENMTKIVVAKDGGKPYQLWMVDKQTNGTVCISASHVSNKCLAEEGGGTEPGSTQVLYDLVPDHPFMQWILKPFADSATSSTPKAAKP